MRTTLSLDEDVSALLKRARAKKKAGLKQVVNEALRQGLQQMVAPTPARRPFKTRPVSLGLCLLGNLDDVAEILAVTEGETFQ